MAKKPTFGGFDPALFSFLTDLAANNDREWFQANKGRYEDDLLEPALAFVAAMAEPLEKLSPHFLAVPKKSGGSLMRIHRDTRFSKDKSPYKTNVGIQLRHHLGKDVHAPGYYVHLDPDQVFLGVGIWHPDATALRGIREAIAEKPKAWTKARDDRTFKRHFHLGGDALKRPPKGFDPEHPLIEDLKRKDFIAVKELGHEDACKRTFTRSVATAFGAATPLMKLLCEAVDVPF